MKPIGEKTPTEFRKIGIRSPALIVGVLLIYNSWVLNLPLLWEFKFGFFAFKMKTIYLKKEKRKKKTPLKISTSSCSSYPGPQNFKVKELLDAYVSSKEKIRFSSLLGLNRHWGKWLQPLLETSLTKGQKRNANSKWKIGKLKNKTGECLKVS